MKLLPRLVIVLAVCLIAMALPAVPTQAQCGVPYIKLSPNSGVPGTEIAVDGQGFAAGKYVDIYYDGTRVATNKTNGNGYFTVFLTVPESCRGDHIVHAVVVRDRADARFTAKPGLTVSPTEGPMAANVTVKGHGFGQDEQSIELMYYLNDNYQTIQRHILASAQGGWEASFLIPPSTKGKHKLDAQGAVSMSYEVKDVTFEVTTQLAMDKTWGSMGNSIAVTGSSFAAYEKNIRILFNGEEVVAGIKADGQGNWEANFLVPEMPAGTYSVAAEGEWTGTEDINALSFEIEPAIVLPPDPGYLGMNLTVAGHGFGANQDVVIMYDGSQKAAATVSSEGSFNVKFTVPKSHHREHQVTAEDSARNRATAIFIMESIPPPVPTPTSPSNGGWVGIVGKVMPTFSWSAVSDDSGARYRLQIATGDNITATGEFADPIISVPDMVETSYTLNATDALPYGTYYWIVQAVDGAENESAWSEAQSFRAGLLPLWGFIAALAVILGFVIALVRLLVRKRRYYYE